jgi:hypothetical protein
MYSNLFSLQIPEGNEVRDQYVEMRHGQTYSLSMRNDRSVPCDAVVNIDGQSVGTWRINAHSSIRIERPADKARLFTFYKLGSSESHQAGLSDDDSLGLVSVEFIPAKPAPEVMRGWGQTKGFDSPPDAYESYGAKGGSFGGPSRSAGGTGLSGASSQQFTTASALDYDRANAFTIHLRLVAVDAAPLIEPLTPRSTPIPQRVG